MVEDPTTQKNSDAAPPDAEGDRDPEQDRHMVPTPHWTQAQLDARRKRGRVLGLVLFGLVILFFVVTLVRLGGNVAERAI